MDKKQRITISEEETGEIISSRILSGFNARKLSNYILVMLDLRTTALNPVLSAILQEMDGNNIVYLPYRAKKSITKKGDFKIKDIYNRVETEIRAGRMKRLDRDEYFINPYTFLKSSLKHGRTLRARWAYIEQIERKEKTERLSPKQITQIFKIKGWRRKAK